MPRTHPSDRWVRARRNGVIVVDSRRALLVWRERPYPFFAFPAEDVRGVESTSLEDVPGHVAVDWNAVDEWLENDEPLVAHARDPFSRIDVRRSSRHVVIEHEDEVIADSTSRHPLSRSEVDTGLLHPRGRGGARPGIADGCRAPPFRNPWAGDVAAWALAIAEERQRRGEVALLVPRLADALPDAGRQPRQPSARARGPQSVDLQDIGMVDLDV